MQEELKKGDENIRKILNKKLNAINRTVQRVQREKGKSFVSRTTLNIGNLPERNVVVLRCAIMNPMTDMKIINKILDEQEEIYRSRFTEDL
jgi:glutamate decarboxylase